MVVVRFFAPFNFLNLICCSYFEYVLLLPHAHIFSVEMITQIEETRETQTIKYKIYELEIELVEDKRKLSKADEARKYLVKQLFEVKIELRAVLESKGR